MASSTTVVSAEYLRCAMGTDSTVCPSSAAGSRNNEPRPCPLLDGWRQRDDGWAKMGESMDSAHQSAPQVPKPHRPHIARRIMSVVCGLVSLGFLVLLWSAREGIADDWAEGFGWIYILQGLLVVGFGAGAMVLWYPKNQRGLWNRILLGAFVAVIVLGGVIFLFAAD